MSRPLYEIAADIRQDWRNVNLAAVPYLEAMGELSSINDKYGADSGKSIVSYFLVNASGWRGPVAKTIKSELNAMLKSSSRAASDLVLRSRLIRLAHAQPQLRAQILPLLREASTDHVAVTDETSAFTDWVILNFRGSPWSEKKMSDYLEGVLDKTADPYVKSEKPKAVPQLAVGDLLIPKPDKAPPENQEVAERFKYQPCTVEKVLDDGVLVKFSNGQTAKFYGTESGSKSGLYRHSEKADYSEAGTAKKLFEAVYFSGGKAEVEEYRKFMVKQYIDRGEAAGQDRKSPYYSGYIISFKQTKEGKIIATMNSQQRPYPVTISPTVGDLLYLGEMRHRPSQWVSDYKRDVAQLLEDEGVEADASK